MIDRRIGGLQVKRIFHTYERYADRRVGGLRVDGGGLMDKFYLTAV